MKKTVVVITTPARIVTSVDAAWSARERQAINAVLVEYFYIYRPVTRWDVGTIFIPPKISNFAPHL